MRDCRQRPSLRRGLLAVLLATTLQACLLESLVATSDIYGAVTFQFGGSVAICVDEGQPGFRGVQCNWDLDGPDADGRYDGEYSWPTSGGDASSLAYFLDPVVLQVPEDVQPMGMTATRDGITRLMPFQTTSFIPIDVDRTVQAAPGHHFVVPDLHPDDEAAVVAAAGEAVAFEFEVQLQQQGEVREVPVTPLFTARVDAPGGTFRPLLLPCVTDLAEVPAITLPVLAFGEEVDVRPLAAQYLEYLDGQSCTDVMFDFGDLGPIEPPVDPPADPVGVRRLAGPDRIGTAVAISQDGWAERSPIAVVLARADGFPDALAGGPLARRLSSPVLLTNSAGLDPRVAEELLRLDPSDRTVVLLGGTAALSPAVEAAVIDLGFEVVREGGSNRFETAVEIATSDVTSWNRSTFMIADGGTYTDALVAGAVGSRNFYPVLLTSGEELPPATRATLAAFPDAARHAVGSGATTAIPDADLAFPEDDPAELSVAAARRYWGMTGTVTIASSADYPDALAGGAHAPGLGPAPLLLTTPMELPAVVREYLRERPPADAVIYGGPAAVHEDVAAALGVLLAR